MNDLPTTAMLLAAGRGTRLGALTDRTPKCMVPVAGRPVLEHNLLWLSRYGVRRVVVNLHHLPDVIAGYLGDGSRWGIEIHYSREPELLGTAGALRRVVSFFERTFFVWYGDNMSTCRLDRLVAQHRARGGVATIALHEREDPTASGIVGLDEDGRITRFLEKPRPEQVFSHWVSAGILVVEPQVFAAIPAAGPSDWGRDVFPALLAAGAALYGYRMAGDERLWWIDTPDDLCRVEEELA